MCGIAGILGGGPDPGALDRMTGAMVHRGPDDEGRYADAHIALGFRRLAIIDLAGGQQPVSNEDGTTQAILNGELYNHREIRRDLERRGHAFRSSSDAEILPHLYEEYGAGLVHHLNGIFALAIWDRRKRRLLLARDAHGVKPLYYADRGDGLLFASELKAMLASGLVAREVDAEAVAQYLLYQAVPPPRTMVAGVRMLPPGALLVHEHGVATVRSYWTPPMEAAHPVTSVEEATELVRDGLDAAVGRQLMSERPLGLFLSGGLDSSVLVALASRHTAARLHTFSVGFAGRDEQVLTEFPWARLVADRYGTTHHEYVLTEDTFRTQMPRVIEAMDQPTADGVNSYYVSLAAARQVTVALSGTGSDELFLGYPRDAALLADHEHGATFDPLPSAYVRAIGRLLPDPDELWPSVARLARSAKAHGAIDGALVGARGVGLFDERARDRLLTAPFRETGPFADKLAYLRADVPPDHTRPADWLIRAEQRAYLSFVLLRDIDAMSMAHSLEVRVPFLDTDFGADLARIPAHWKLRHGVGKWILRQAVADLLPEGVLTRPKMGFGLPYNVWMRRSLGSMVRDTLAPARLARRGMLDAPGVAALVNRFYAGDDTDWRKVWALFVLESWCSQMLDAAPLAFAPRYQHKVAS